MGPSTFTDTKSTTFSEVSNSYTYCILPHTYCVTIFVTTSLCIYRCFLSSALGSSGQRAEGNGL